MTTYYSHGKLLITGEYLVLKGAIALAVPTKFGQKMEVSEESASLPLLEWRSFDHKGQLWFEESYPVRSLKEIEAKNEVSLRLKALLLECCRLNPEFLSGNKKWVVETFLEFPSDWGLGSSSTLVNNLAQWARVDPFKLQYKIFGGSGYDIACARSDKPLYFKKIKDKGRWDNVEFNPPFRDKLYFLHLGHKQDSREAIASFEAKSIHLEPFIRTITHLTISITNSRTLQDFEQLINKHESVLSAVLKSPGVKQEFFPDYWGIVKSLGAWGGDFVMVSSNRNFDDCRNYFLGKGFSTLLAYDEMVLE